MKREFLEVKLVDQSFRRHAKILEIRHGVQRPLDLRIAPDLVVAHGDKPSPAKAGRRHLVVRRRKQLQHEVVHAFPVRAVTDQMALIARPDDITAVDHESCAAGLHLADESARHPFTALQLEHFPVHAWKQLHVLDRGPGKTSPGYLDRQRHHFTLGHERHDDLANSLVLGSKIIFTSRFTTSSATLSGMTSPNISTNKRTRSGCPSLDRQVHHRPGVAARREGKSLLLRRRLCQCCAWHQRSGYDRAPLPELKAGRGG